MPKSKKNSRKPSVKVNDLRAKKNPKGGGKKASPLLMQACATGKHITKAQLVMRSSSDDDTDTTTLSPALITDGTSNT